MKKTVLITGGASGIGESISKKFAENGYNVAINYLNSKLNAEKLKKDIEKDNNVRCEIYKCDVGNESEAEKMFSDVLKDFGNLEVLVSNAGVALKKLYVDCTKEDFDRIFNTNVAGAFNVSKFACKSMIDNQFGKIIFISSVFGEKGASCEALYAASKGAVNSLAKSLAREMGLSHINVNAISAGMIDTKMNNNLTDDEKAEFVSGNSLNRIGLPDEIAKVALFLADEKSAYINGQIINVDGGF